MSSAHKSVCSAHKSLCSAQKSVCPARNPCAPPEIYVLCPKISVLLQKSMCSAQKSVCSARNPCAWLEIHLLPHKSMGSPRNPCADEHGCRSQHVFNSNSASIKHLLLLPSPTASSQPTLPHSIHHLLSIIHHQWQLLILSLLKSHHLNFPNIQ